MASSVNVYDLPFITTEFFLNWSGFNFTTKFSFSSPVSHEIVNLLLNWKMFRDKLKIHLETGFALLQAINLSNFNYNNQANR